MYIVSSDDPNWCREGFQQFNDRATFFYADDFRKDHGLNVPELEMSIATRCNHTIFDYGTFGFWGAYLSGGYTILAENIGDKKVIEVENIRPAKLKNWEFIEAFV